ncbi:HNH endonuclease [Iamia sp.]|uniref:HNH endonuclease n=1 Tax=Iamia sp. TaxID=2722710 RepID=UPI0032C24A5F
MCGVEADSIDHVKPLSKGGAHMLSNLRPSCRSCNSRKGARWPFATSHRRAPLVLSA